MERRWIGLFEVLGLLLLLKDEISSALSQGSHSSREAKSVMSPLSELRHTAQRQSWDS